ncbi:MAG: hypothetical protein KDB03_01755 [Planctomycetales bacterium]|nr:hypothetical protein [Planctomycetales bacterium]
MSTAKSLLGTKSPLSGQSRSAGVRDELAVHLRKAAGFIKALELVLLCFTWVAGAILWWFLACVLDHWIWPLPAFGRWVFWFLGVGCTAWWLVSRVLPLLLRRINPTFAARRIELLAPEFKNGLISWYELEQLPDNGVPRGIMAAMAYRAARIIGGQDVSATVDSSPLVRLVGLVLVLVASQVAYTIASPKSSFVTARRILFPWTSQVAPTRVHILKVEPGATEVSQGKPLEIVAEVKGLHKSEEIWAVFSTRDGQFVENRVLLDAEVDGLRYRGKITTDGPGVEHELDYWLVAGDAQSDKYRVTISPLPSLALESFHLEYPQYTQLASQVVQNTNALEVLEGTTATITAISNQPMQRGRIEINPELDKSGELIRTTATLGLQPDGSRLEGQWKLQLNSKRDNPTAYEFRLRGFNSRGDGNRDPILHSLKVVGDIPPEVSLMGPPNRILRVMPNSIVNLEVRANDPDFGLTRIDLDVNAPRAQQTQLNLLSAERATGRQVKLSRLDLASLRVREGDRIEVVATAQDNRHDPVSQSLQPNQSESEPLILQVVGRQELADVKSETASAAEDNSSANNESTASQTSNTSSKNNAGQTASSENRASKSDPANSDNASSSGKNNQDGSKSEQTRNSETGNDDSQSGSSTGDSTNESRSGNSENDNANTQPQQNPSGAAKGSDGSTGSSTKTENSGQQTGSSSSNSASGSTRSDSQQTNGGTSSSKAIDSSQPDGQNRVPPNDSTAQSTNNSEPSKQDGASSEGNPTGRGEVTDGQSTGDGRSAPQPEDAETMEKIKDYIERQGGTASDKPSEPNGGQADNKDGKSQTSTDKPSTSQTNPQNTDSEATSPPKGNADENNLESNNARADQLQPNSNSVPSSTQNAQPKPGSQENSQSQSNQQGSANKGTDSSEASSESGSTDNSESESQNTSSTNSESNSTNNKNASNSDQNEIGTSSNNPANPANEGSDANSSDSGGSNGNDASASSNSAQSSSSQNESSSSSSGEDSQSSKSENRDASKGSEAESSASTGKGNPSSDENSAGNSSQSQSSNNQQNNSSQPAEVSEPANSQSTGEQENKSSNKENASSSNANADSETSGASAGSAAESSSPSSDGNGGKPTRGSTGGGMAGGGGTQGSTGIGGQSAGGSNSVEGSEINRDFSEETANMVLDYLTRQKDQADPELLKELSWTQDDLDKFVDRWQRARELGYQGVADKLKNSDLLRDLQLGAENSGLHGTAGINDDLRKQLDAGSRSQLPPGIRKQFEAFQRAIQGAPAN